MEYKILLHSMAYKKAEQYLNDLVTGKTESGHYLQQRLKTTDFSQLTVRQLIESILQTKKPQIFAESQVHGDGSDWNQRELSIMGDISISVPVTIYDKGSHSLPELHNPPISGTLLYTPGVLLRNDFGHIPADWNAVVEDRQINYQMYYSLYERRLLPLFMHANTSNKKAFITIPGIGCGLFAGRFSGELGSLFKQALYDLLSNFSVLFPNIKAVYYDPYSECFKERFDIDGISFLVRPLMLSNNQKPQLCKPEEYEEEEDDFSACHLFSFVAWDHVSWPGNDFYAGCRTTDDGVKAAATNSMAKMTGVEGGYNTTSHMYNPPVEYNSWEELIMQNNIQINMKDNLIIFQEHERILWPKMNGSAAHTTRRKH